MYVGVRRIKVFKVWFVMIIKKQTNKTAGIPNIKMYSKFKGTSLKIAWKNI